MTWLSLFENPIIQGPTAGGANTPEQVAAVSNAGALGSLAGSLLSPDTLRSQVAAIRERTARPFCLNFFVQNIPSPTAEEVALGEKLLRPVLDALGWDKLPMPAKWCEDFHAQFEALIELKPAVASFTFNQLHKEQVSRLQAAGIAVVGTITTVDEALAWQAAGADGVIASGIEAGGHRGTFIGPQKEARLTTFELLPAVVRAVDIPVVAAGGIMRGADIARALAQGAQAVQMGTAFLVTDESAIHPAYKQRLLQAGEHATRQTRAFSGRYARGLDNRFMQLMGPVEDQVPAYPVQNALTGSIRAEAAKRNDTEWMSLWCGTQVHRARGMPAAQLVQTLVNELAEAIKQ